MSNPIDVTILNYIVDVEELYSAITDTFAELIDLGEDETFRRLLISNKLNQDVVIRFYNITTEAYSELAIPADAQYALDWFRHNGVIEIKYKTDAPTVGYFKFVSWRGE